MIKITINQEEYPVIVTKKRIKNINLRINESNKITISCPSHYKEQDITDFITKHQNWLTSRILKNKQKSQDLIHLEDERSVYLFGNEYKVKQTLHKEDHLKIIDDTILIVSGMPIYVYYHHVLLEHASKLLDSHQIKATLKIKKYRSRWGCCKYQTREIILNEKLIALPWELIDYVIYHELSHLQVPNHSPSFYKSLSLLCPEYKKYRQVIKKYRIMNERY